MKLLLATGNSGKVADLKAMLKDDPIEILSLADFPDLPEVVEDGETFLDNARKKAWTIARKTGLPTLADDSGLMVDALDGRPGVHSARYGGVAHDDARNLAKLLGELEEYQTEEQRAARFVCVLVYAGTDGTEHVTEGQCLGSIAHKPRGENGFGYDPVFIHPRFDELTLAEVSRDEKNSVSHRGEAFKKMLVFLRSLSRQGE